jgi:two-component system, sensor histidine kinase RegB
VRLRTLVLLRWLAVFGQSVAVLVAVLWLGLDILHVPCVLVIGGAAVFIAVITAFVAENRRLTERQAVLTLLFDLCQLGALLYLIRGLGNASPSSSPCR